MASFAPPAPSQTQLVGNRLVELCNAGKHYEAMQELYADNARHVEVMEMPGSPYKRVTEGKAELLQKAEHWNKHVTVHSSHTSKACANGDQFVCEMSMDCTSDEGPMAGQRMQMKETALYTVANGKITEAKFFYPTCG